MPRCQLSDSGPVFTEPPIGIRELSSELYEYLLAFHRRSYGLGPDATGDLGSDNISGDLTDTKDHGLLDDVLAYQHHGDGQHALLDQAVAVPDAGASAVSVEADDATDLPTVLVLANEQKADLNTLVGEVNALVATVNALLTAMRTAKQVAP